MTNTTSRRGLIRTALMTAGITQAQEKTPLKAAGATTPVIRPQLRIRNNPETEGLKLIQQAGR